MDITLHTIRCLGNMPKKKLINNYNRAQFISFLLCNIIYNILYFCGYYIIHIWLTWLEAMLALSADAGSKLLLANDEFSISSMALKLGIEVLLCDQVMLDDETLIILSALWWSAELLEGSASCWIIGWLSWRSRDPLWLRFNESLLDNLRIPFIIFLLLLLLLFRFKDDLEAARLLLLDRLISFKIPSMMLSAKVHEKPSTTSSLIKDSLDLWRRSSQDRWCSATCADDPEGPSKQSSSPSVFSPDTMISGMSNLPIPRSVNCCCQRASWLISITVGTLLDLALCGWLWWCLCSLDFLKIQEPLRVLGGVGFIGVAAGVMDVPWVSESASPAQLGVWDVMTSSWVTGQLSSSSSGDIRSKRRTIVTRSGGTTTALWSLYLYTFNSLLLRKWFLDGFWISFGYWLLEIFWKLGFGHFKYLVNIQ